MLDEIICYLYIYMYTYLYNTFFSFNKNNFLLGSGWHKAFILLFERQRQEQYLYKIKVSLQNPVSKKNK